MRLVRRVVGMWCRGMANIAASLIALVFFMCNVGFLPDSLGRKRGPGPFIYYTTVLPLSCALSVFTNAAEILDPR